MKGNLRSNNSRFKAGRFIKKHGQKPVFLPMAASIFLLSVSCQKVIDLDLFSSKPRLVVEANISDHPGPYIVKLSKTINFDEITGFAPLTGALVELTDSAGSHETLSEVGGGIYITNTFAGVPGHRYTLTITAEGQAYSAVSEMPMPVPEFRPSISKDTGNSPGQNVQYKVSFEINDPPEAENYYRLVVFHNNRQISSRRVFNDELNNGKLITGEFHLHDSLNFDPGDIIEIDLQNIDKSVYNFFRTLRDGTGSMSFLSASPSNPLSNITNNGLGYFNACSVTEKIMTIPK